MKFFSFALVILLSVLLIARASKDSSSSSESSPSIPSKVSAASLPSDESTLSIPSKVSPASLVSDESNCFEFAEDCAHEIYCKNNGDGSFEEKCFKSDKLPKAIQKHPANIRKKDAPWNFACPVSSKKRNF